MSITRLGANRPALAVLALAFFSIATRLSAQGGPPPAPPTLDQQLYAAVTSFLTTLNAAQLGDDFRAAVASAGLTSYSTTLTPGSNQDATGVYVVSIDIAGSATAGGSADGVIAVGANQGLTSTLPGGNATATNTGPGFAIAIAGHGGFNDAAPGAGGAATASALAPSFALAIGGQGGAGLSSGAAGGDASATTSGEGGFAAASGGQGGDPRTTNGATGGQGGRADASKGPDDHVHARAVVPTAGFHGSGGVAFLDVSGGFSFNAALMANN
jgi:hypothetical protein